MLKSNRKFYGLYWMATLLMNLGTYNPQNTPNFRILHHLFHLHCGWTIQI